MNPDHLILMADSDSNVLEGTMLWNNLNAVKNHHVYRITSRQNYNEAFTSMGKNGLLEQIADDMIQKNQ